MATKRGNDDSPPLEEINFLNIHQRSLFHSEPDPFKSICTEKQRFVAFSKQMAKHVCNESQQLWSDIHLRKMNLVVDNYDAQKSINNDCDSISKMVKQSRRQTDAKKWKSSLSSVKLSMLDELPSPYNCEVSSAEKNLIKTLRNNAENQPPPPPPSKMDSHRKMDQTNNFTKPKMKGPQLDHRNEGDSFNNWNNRCSVSSGTNRSANSRSTMDIDGDYPNNTDRRWGSPAASFFENKHPSSSKHASFSWDTNHFSGRQNGDSNHFSGRQNGDSNHFSGRQNVSGYNSSSSHSNSIFKTATEELKIQNANKYGNSNGPHGGESSSSAYGNYQKKSLGGLGGRPRSVSSKFKPPIPTEENRNSEEVPLRGGNSEGRSDLLKCIDEKMIELIENEIMDSSSPITWDDIAGLEFAKKTIQEIVVLPFLRPDLFTGLRSPPKGILLFGPPGTGKTLIGKCIASESESTFFSISASSLTSKWIGDGEKMVRALFAVARSRQPSVIFIDEIDSLLSQRSDTEHESSRRMKTEFLVQLDGATTGDDDRILIIGATNRPQELDEAARRRLIKRLYIPLPDKLARFQIVSRLMMSERNSLTDEQIERISCLTDGYSGADMKCVCKEASLEPIRSIDISKIKHISALDVRPITIDDFLAAVSRVKSSVSSKDLDLYLDWDKQFGSGTAAR